MLEEFKNKNILILGFGIEGRDSLRFLKSLFPGKIIGIADKNTRLKNNRINNVRWHLGNDYLSHLKDYDLMIKSPGIPANLLSKLRLKKPVKITSQAEIFFDNCPGMIIGITGTKGKSTTASLIYHILKAGGLRTHLIGNIGNPVLNFLFSATDKDIYVYELSCHQLSTLQRSPHIAVLLNIYPEHLDYYQGIKEYIEAKSRITKYQRKNDYLIYNPHNTITREIARRSKAKKIPINYKKWHIALAEFSLKGRFNYENAVAAMETAKILGISREKIIEAIKTFKPLPHRLELVGKYKGIAFYNDSLSTIPESAISAIDALGKDVQTVILGGLDRKISFRGMAKYILKKRHIKNIILFPETGNKIWKEIIKEAKRKKIKNLPSPLFTNSMKEAVKNAYLRTDKGKICLLSPASASFNLFRNYEQRGNLFKRYIKLYAKKKKLS